MLQRNDILCFSKSKRKFSVRSELPKSSVASLCPSVGTAATFLHYFTLRYIGKGVQETRTARSDGANSIARVLLGGKKRYPEVDI